MEERVQAIPNRLETFRFQSGWSATDRSRRSAPSGSGAGKGVVWRCTGLANDLGFGVGILYAR